MSGTRDLPMSTTQIQRRIQQAWSEVQQARRDADISAMLRAEKRMNGLLDQLFDQTQASLSA